jgi:hypothetical protein
MYAYGKQNDGVKKVPRLMDICQVEEFSGGGLYRIDSICANDSLLKKTGEKVMLYG